MIIVKRSWSAYVNSALEVVKLLIIKLLLLIIASECSNSYNQNE